MVYKLQKMSARLLKSEFVTNLVFDEFQQYLYKKKQYCFEVSFKLAVKLFKFTKATCYLTLIL